MKTRLFFPLHRRAGISSKQSEVRRAAGAVSRPRTTVGFESLERRFALAADGLPAFDIGNPSVTDLWVDPAGGDDAGSGTSRQEALRTLSEAWRRVPAGTTLSQGVCINLVAGTYPEAAVPNYWERRHGTLAAPIILRAADGAGTARLPAMNVFDCRHLYLEGLHLSAGGGDVLHLEACSHVLVRRTTIVGTGDIYAYAAPQETFKANQCQHVFVEQCDISGATDNAIDFVAVQYGHVVGSRIHRSVDWAIYVKGGSASLTIEGNEIFDAGTGGFTAGQGTGFEFMVSPWLHYEAYDIRFVNNVVHDTQGAGMGVNGGYNILLAHNTLYRVGARSHVIEVVHGSRTCDGDRATAAAYLAAGGWGTTVVGGDEPIPSRNVFIFNNVVHNPDGFASQWQHFTVAGPRPAAAGSNIPSPALVDTNLLIQGNVIWNGSAGMALGIESPALAADVLAHNSINTIRPLLADPARGDYRLAAGFVPPAAATIPDFSWDDAPSRPAIPAGRLDNRVGHDFVAAARTGPAVVGAFAATADGTPPAAAGPGAGQDVVTTGPTPVPDSPPALRIASITLPAARLYRAGETIVFQAVVTTPVTVRGRPRLPVQIGSGAVSTMRSAIYTRGSGGTVLTFVYRVARGDVDDDGIALGGEVSLPTGTSIRALSGGDVARSLPATATAGIRIDTRPPRAMVLTVPAAGTYRAGDVITLAVTFGEPVVVTGVPRIAVRFGGGLRQATSVEGAETGTLTFRITVTAGDPVYRGLAFPRSIRLPAGATIRDPAGNDASLGLVAVRVVRGSTASAAASR